MIQILLWVIGIYLIIGAVIAYVIVRGGGPDPKGTTRLTILWQVLSHWKWLLLWTVGWLPMAIAMMIAEADDV